MGIGSKLGWSAVRHLGAFALTGGAANVACAAWDFYDVYDTVTTVADISDATDVMSGGSDVRFGGDDGGLLHDTYTDVGVLDHFYSSYF
jgi:hypothetical protein